MSYFVRGDICFYSHCSDDIYDNKAYCIPCTNVLGGHYGLVVVTPPRPPSPPPRPQTLNRFRAFWATQGPSNSQKCTFCYIVAHIWKICSYLSLVIHMSALWWGLTVLKFSFTWVRRKPPPPIWNKVYIFLYFGFKLKKILSDCFLIWHVHRYGIEESWRAR